MIYSIVKDSSVDLGVNSKIVQIRPTAQYGHSQSEKKLGLGDKYHRSIKVHT